MTPDEYTIKEHSIATEDGLHELYVQEWGNSNGTPILYLHGGPGNGCNDSNKNKFNPDRHRVIFVDQRGSGNSKPYASLENNTTQFLVNDLELIRDKLNIDQWVITGGSWGSTLALCYAIKYPKYVSQMILDGIFLGTNEEVEWLYGTKIRDFYPEIWEKFLARTPAQHHNNPAAYHLDRLGKAKTTKEYKKSSYALFMLDSFLYKLDIRGPELSYEDYDPDIAKITFSYCIDNRNSYLPANYILDNSHKLIMPITILQGRYDMICRPAIAYELHKALPNSSLIYTLAGHSGSDRNTYDAAKAVLAQL